ncbi:PKD domain containing protein [Pseudobacteroides cellulosolvens ATCC 35603 = DSM 2933]|uniref:PKD domain containing protein n=2 Tax=Pseudobacteroides cellulosolvens TaxID=35825 RepID=A0A0L6JKD3_9FIRM|nr:PKD domain containing protein [Pseudobacteroides cellulosolvens ATCC 35603 = DSM 2933]
MTNPLDYVKVGGSFFIQSDNVNDGTILYEGIIEVKGDIVQKSGQYYNYGYYDRKNNFAPGGNHKVILSGADVQNISFQNSAESYFNILESKNYSQKGINFISSFNAKSFINNNCNITLTSINSMEWKLNEDTIINSTVYLLGNTLDLNGHKLTINGSLIQSGGVLSINGGSLIVNGDYRIQTESKASDGTITYVKGNGCLKMLNKNDYVLVSGNFYIQSGDVNGPSMLNAGVLEVKGDFIQLAGQYYNYGTYDRKNNFTPGGNHKVVLSGSEVQNVNFQYPNDSFINILQITKPIETGYTFNKTPVWKQLIYDVESPSIPLELKSTFSSETSISLSWTASTDNDGVAGYEIYRNGSLAGYVKNNEYTDSGLKPGKEYTYMVRAADAGHNVSEFSNEIIAKTLADTEKPSAPGSFSAYFIDTTVYLSWTASTDNVGVTRYDIYRDGEFVGSTGTTEYKDLNLELNKKYSYMVKSYDAADNWADAAVEMVLSDDHSNDMGDATGVEIGKDTAGTINYRGDIDWFKFTTTNAGYYSLTGKGVTDLVGNIYKADGTLLSSGEGIGDRFTVTGAFEANMEYYIKIKYISSFSTGVYLIKVSELDNEPPNAPTGLTAVKKTPVSISLKWDAATDNTGVLGYKLYRDGILIKDTTSTEFNDTGLNPETSYTYTVRAYDDLKNLSIESVSLKESTEKDIDAPSIPVDLKISSVKRLQNDTGAKVSVGLVWSSSTDNVKVGGYEIYRDGVRIGTTDKHDYLDSDAVISESNIYIYAVKAFDTSNNYSADSIPVTFDNEAPTAPTDLKETGKTEKSVVLCWNPSTDSIGIKGYEIYRDGIKIGTSTSNNFTVNSLEPDKTYIFKVYAFDGQGNFSDSSNEFTITTTIDTEKPSIPANLRLVSKTGTTVTIAWDASTDNVAVGGYEILKDGVTAGTTGTTSYKFEGLTTDTMYKFNIKAYDTSNNISGESAVFSVIPRLPSEPSSLEVLEKPYSIVLRWSSSDNDIASYKVYKGSSAEGLSFWTNCNTSNIELTGLNGGTTVYFKVSSIDKWGNESTKSGAISGTTLVDSIAPSVSLLVPEDNYRSSGNITLKAAGKDNFTLEKFVFEYSIPNEDKWTAICESYAVYNGSTKEYQTDISWNTKGLSGNYLVRAIAKDKSGNESEPLAHSIIIDNTAPDVPTNVSAVASPGKIIIKWSPVQAGDISSYSIYRKSSEAGANFSLITTVKASIFEYTDYNVDSGKTYIYCVIAVDDLKNESSRSGEAQATAGDFVPAISINPEVVKPSDEISITGEGFRPLETVEIYIDESTFLFNTKSDSTGNVTASWKYLKNVSPGNHSIKLKGQSSLAEATASFKGDVSLLKPPAGITAKAGEIEVTLSWQAVGSINFYRLYRKTGDEPLVKVMDNIKGIIAKDISVKSGSSYQYQLASVDIYGNEGSLSDPIDIIPLGDSTKPVLSGFTASRYGETLKLATLSSDNIGVESMKFYYRLGSGEWKEIAAVTTIPERNKTVGLGYDWNTSALKTDGNYEVKAVAYDEAGNFSDDKIIGITIRNTKPLSPQEVNATSGQLRIDVDWTQVMDDDFLKYKLYRRVNGGEYILLRETTLRSYQDTAVSLGKSYEYKVTAVDTYGHESDGTVSGTSSALPDTTAPELKNLLPSSGSRIKGKVNISAIASDNVCLSKVDFMYSVKINGVQTWLTLGSAVSGTVCWDTASTVTDGLCEIKVVAKDTSGNTSELKASYIVDNTAPDAPVITAKPQELKVSLTWQPVASADDLDHYNVYRGNGITPSYKLIGSTADKIFVDSNAVYAVENLYKVTSVDKGGNESLGSNIVSCIPGKDTTPPVIDKFLPGEGTALRGTVSFTAHAKDNINVKNYKLEIRKVDENNQLVGNGEWQLVSSLENQGTNDVRFVLDTTLVSQDNSYKYPDGRYQVKITAADSENNNAENIYGYMVTNDPPAPPEKLYVEAGEWQLVVSWSPVLRADFDHYVLYRKEGKNGNWEKILNGTTSNAYIDRMLDPSKEYYYAVSAVNDMNRESAMTRDYSNDTNISDDIKTHSLQETSVPVIREVKPAELSHISNSAKLESQVDDKVSVKVRYEYSYLGESESSTITGEETWQLIGEDNNPGYRSANPDGLIEDYINGNLTSFKNYFSGFVSHCDWDTSALASGCYAVRVTAINTGNKESSVYKRYIIDRIPPARPAGLQISDPKIGGQLDLSWKMNTEADIDGYKILRSETNGGPYELIGNTKGFIFRDEKVQNGKVYYYVVSAYDLSGNESQSSVQAAGAASAISDLSIKDIKLNPVSPAYDRKAQITVVAENLGYANAKGKVELYIKDSIQEWKLIEAKNVELSGANHYDAVFEWTPEKSFKNPVEVKAVVTTTDSTTETNSVNNSKIIEANINQPPIAAIECSEWIYSGDTYTLNGATGTNGQLSKDSDGKIVWYKWNLGDGIFKEGAQVTHVYQTPGSYTVTLTVCDNNGAESSTTAIVDVRDNRPI